ncbi:MAG: NPCBM/NEW2 domain-containing protein [Planctomycetaceae bacterium]
MAETAVITRATASHAVPVEADISGATDLYLVVSDGGDGFTCDWADWAEPKLSGPTGDLKLTDLKWKTASSDWGIPAINLNAGGTSLRIDGKPVKYGIGTHANSVIHFVLPEGYTRFTATCGLDNGGTDQSGGTASSVKFLVYTSAPPTRVQASGDGRDPATALAGIDVANGVEASLFAAEPMLLSPSNIDIDHLGRVWVCEVVNYRQFANKSNPGRAEGDRILILEDTDGDGVADKETTFYQGRDIDSAHGVCVLGDKVIVSAGDSVFCFYDDDGDQKCDRKEILFTGIKGTQHDHGIHSFTFGPDGRLYFNFGNSGNELHNPDGSLVVDIAGNEVIAHRHPYQEGMAFRCEPDGSKVDTLGWNFRNNWELCVDSFGTVWQSDNDDDGNKGVRINYVMEYGNYGYKDEISGAGWREARTNLEKEIPLQHWHLNDPGVVPNLLQTGAGSPTGMICYEGDRLPERFINQLIHCDAGPNVVRSYSVNSNGAGYSASVNDILVGTRDQWFRPSDVCVAPDGSLIVADWYDPGVGGHRQGDVTRGRLFRVSLPGQPYSVPKHDFSTVEGAARALKSPNVATRFLAFTKLKESGVAAESTLLKMFQSDPNTRFRARALWLLGQIADRTQKYVDLAIADDESDIRIVGLRLARRTGMPVLPLIAKLADDSSAQVRRECAVALRNEKSSPEKTKLWVALAGGYDGTDRWYLESLGISLTTEQEWNSALPSLQKSAPSEVFLDLVWRGRGKVAAGLKMAAITDLAKRDSLDTAHENLLRYFRSLDFDSREVVSGLCLKLLQPDRIRSYPPTTSEMIIAESLARLSGTDAESSDAKSALATVLKQTIGTSQFVRLVERFQSQQHYAELLQLARRHPAEQIGVEAISALLSLKQWQLINEALRGENTEAAIATAEAMGNTQSGAISGPLLAVIRNDQVNIEVRRACVRAAAKVNNAAMELVKSVEEDTIDPELTQAIAAALHASPSRNAREQAQRLFPLPPSKDDKPTPPVSELIQMRGDAQNGRLVFFTTGTCHKCHVVDGMGREIGPNLSEIGSKLSREAMFESVLFPSAGISHNYEAWTAVLTSGTTVSGLLTSTTDNSISIKGDDAIIRTFKRSEIEELVKQKSSLMPSDLQKIISAQELADLVEFMQTLKKK